MHMKSESNLTTTKKWGESEWNIFMNRIPVYFISQCNAMFSDSLQHIINVINISYMDCNDY